MLTLNRYPLSALGLVPTDITEWLTAPTVTRDSASVLRRLGFWLGARKTARPRVLRIGVLAPLTVETERPGIIARVNHALRDQRVAIETADRPGVQTWGVVVDIGWREAAANAPKIAVPAISGVIELAAVDGGSEDIEPSAPVLLGTTPVAVPAGTLPTGGMVQLWGYTAPVTLTYTPANGLGATALTVNAGVAAGEHVALNLDTGDAFLVPTSGLRARIPTTGLWPTLDPDDAAGVGLIDGTGAGVVHGTLAVSSGTGLWMGRRRWRL